MSGINDVFENKMTAPEYAKLYDYIFGELKRKCSGCKIYVQSMLPVRGTIAKMSAAHINQMVMAVNRELKATAQKQGLIYLDLYPAFCDAKGEMKAEYSDDGVHPNRRGYDAWAKLVTQQLKE
jgi:lysophospholipase L1-like esterase